MKENKIFSACQHDCPDNCAIISDVVNGVVTRVRGNPEHPYTQGFLCSKVKTYEKRVYSENRILYPMKRIGRKSEKRFEKVTWEDALREIKKNFLSTIEKNGPQSILPFSYLGHQGLLNGLHCGDRFFNKLGASIGERTFCNSTASRAYRMVAGPSGGLDPESFAISGLVILWGINIVSTSVHHFHFIQKAIKKGAKFVVIDPVRTKTARRAHVHIRPLPGTDVVLALAIANYLIEQNLIDLEYIKRYTKGFSKFAKRAQRFSIKSASEITGVPIKQIEQLSLLISRNKATAIRTGVGLERTRNGGDAIRAIASIPALTGAWTVPGGGIFQHPHNTFPINRQALANPDIGEQKRNSINLFDLAKHLDKDAEIKINSLFVYNANPVVAAADQTKLIRNLLREDLFIVVSEIFQTDTCDYADIILPAASQLEQQDLMYSWGHFNLQFNEKAIEPLGESVSNTELFRRLAKAFSFNEPLFSQSDEELIEQALDWNHESLKAITPKTLRKTGFARLNVGEPKSRVPHQFGSFPTPSGKFEFYSSQYLDGNKILSVYRQGIEDTAPHRPVDPLPKFRPRKKTDSNQFILISPKHHHFLNSGYTNLADSSELSKTQTVLINPDDAMSNEINTGDAVKVWNSRGSLYAVAQVSDDVINEVIVVNHGFWMKHLKGNTVNALTESCPSEIGRGITVNDTIVHIKKIQENKIE